jgi:hypothetical protein
MRSRVASIGLTLSACLLLGLPAQAAVPGAVVEQGRLFDAAGAPLGTTTTLTFAVYASATGGAPLCKEATDRTV